ncbi:MAG: FG-GAP repeat protein [Parcubacteria group bacterium ADurb.Bin115]|nr:MAG: FG-GAP repeat protein [Parcubacteria group bacterium ADurb.Bin115]HQO11243.1 putative glycoside hydrolase [bacterium]
MYLRISLIVLTFLFCWPRLAAASESYPRLANYFLKWEMTETEAKELARWDLLILDMENQENNPELIRQIRTLNPDVKILAYITSQEIIDNPEDYNNAWLRQELASKIPSYWYLKDEQGRAVVNWPFTSMLNLSERASKNGEGWKFNELLPKFIHERLQSSGLWDGVFYDNLWGDIAWVNGGNLDFDNDGQRETSLVANSLWAEGVAKMLRFTRELCGSQFIIMGNGRIYWPYQNIINGMMFEGFPSSWENGGTWTGSMESYEKLSRLNVQPQTTVINVYHKNQEDYQNFRYGFSSALLGNGYYSFDYDVTNHGQTWWYDEYNVNLGSAQSGAYNLLNGGQTDWQAGLWRRDFKNGLTIVNSTDKVQSFSFAKEEFEKIKGTQAPEINNGLKINFIRLNPKDGVILLKKLAVWRGSGFTNGGFLRIFNSDGAQVRHGFFSYLSSLPSGSEILVDDFLNDGDNDYIFSSDGKLFRQRHGQNIWSLQPFAPGFKGKISLAAGDINGDGQMEIIIGAGKGGGPQVMVFSFEGKVLLNFFAYDKNFRGGVNVAAGDINGDGKDEIITGAGPGGGPHVRIFNHDGQVISSFFAYSEDFKDGVSVGFSEQSGQPEIAVGIKGF